MPQRQWSSTAATLVHDILEGCHHVRDTAEAAAETSDCGHGTAFLRQLLSIPFTTFKECRRRRVERDLLSIAACLRGGGCHLTDTADWAVYRSRKLLERGEGSGVLVVVACAMSHWLGASGLSFGGVLLPAVGGFGVGWFLVHGDWERRCEI